MERQSEGGRAFLKESCAKNFSGRTGLGSMTNNFRQSGLISAKGRLGSEKAGSRQMEASSYLPSLGFFGLLRNLRPATRTGPDLGGLFAKRGCNSCFENNGAAQPWRDSTRLRRGLVQT